MLEHHAHPQQPSAEADCRRSCVCLCWLLWLPAVDACALQVSGEGPRGVHTKHSARVSPVTLRTCTCTLLLVVLVHARLQGSGFKDSGMSGRAAVSMQVAGIWHSCLPGIARGCICPGDRTHLPMGRQDLAHAHQMTVLWCSPIAQSMTHMRLQAVPTQLCHAAALHAPTVPVQQRSLQEPGHPPHCSHHAQ